MFFIFIGCAAVCGYAPNDYAPSRILGACRVQSVIVSIILGRGTEFEEGMWSDLVECMTVYAKDDLRFMLPCETEITA